MSPAFFVRISLVIATVVGVAILQSSVSSAFVTFDRSQAVVNSFPRETTLCSVKPPKEQEELQKQGTIDNEEVETILPEGPSFFEALFGIAINGSPWEYMLQMKRQGYDGVVPVDLKFAGAYNFLLSPEAVRVVTVEQAKLLPRRFSVPLFETLELDRGIVYEQGDRHRRNKKICLPSFEQSQSMESFVEATKAELDGLSDEFRAKANSEESNTIDLYAEMRRSALNVVLDVSFGLGKEAASNFEKAEELSATIAEYLERIVALANEIPPLWQISPRLSYNYVRVTDVVLPNLRTLVSEVIEARRAEGEESQSKRNRADLLGVLVEQLEDNADIRSILFDVVIAGSDTTASTATAATYILHQPQHKDWLERAREEAITTNAGREVPLDKLRTTMPVCVAIAREVLRLYPPVPFVGRTATGAGTLVQSNYPVSPGDTFCFSPWFLGRDPSQWGEDADEFNPQRWLDDDKKGGATSTFSWLPFGAGSRGCLGTRLGLTEVVLGIARLLKDFEFEFETTGPLPVRYDLTLNLDGVMDCTIRNRT
mmetsp:Transcript_17974/g.44753  ORF Transcript_17974/g.44753 Transcript_17974/m.44753 type:complete len:541 (-) Transcript_17974:129-1751(-)